MQRYTIRVDRVTVYLAVVEAPSKEAAETWGRSVHVDTLDQMREGGEREEQVNHGVVNELSDNGEEGFDVEVNESGEEIERPPLKEIKGNTFEDMMQRIRSCNP